MISTADLFDTFPHAVDVCTLQFRTFGKRASFHGPVETLAIFESHVPVREALSQPGEGRVLVVDGRGSVRVGVLGDRLGVLAVKNGWKGVIINGAIRDSEAVNALEIGVKAMGTTARRNLDGGPSEQGAILEFGNVRVSPGSWVYADADAVVFSETELDPTRATEDMSYPKG